jgi:hypothetical protein
MTEPKMSSVTPAQQLDRILHDPEAQRIEEDLLRRLALDASATPTPATDPLWLSALRGRLMAAIASATGLAASGAMLYQSVQTIASGAPQVGMAGAVADLAQHTVSMVDAGLALTMAAASLIALLASINSKAREWLRGLGNRD